MNLFDAPQPPHNLDAEQALLGAILLSNSCFESVDGRISADDFFDPIHAKIFDVTSRDISAGRLANPITVRQHFDATEVVTADLTVHQYLGTLAGRATTTRNVGAYADTIRDLARCRSLVVIGEELTARGYSGSAPSEAIEATEQHLFALAERAANCRDEVVFADAAMRAVRAASDAYASGGRMRGLSTGFTDLDAKIGGLQETDLIIIAGRPSMGKTALATNIAWNVARQGLTVDFRSMEMSADQLALRIMAAEIGVPGGALRTGTCSGADIEALTRAEARLRDTPLIIDESGGLTIAQLAARARRTKRKHGTALLVIDYLQLMSGGKRRDGNRVQEVTEITVGLKALAKELQVPIIALSQLSRGVEGRNDKRPQLSDLRESGSIEQDADVVLFVYREEYYAERTKPDPSDMDATLAWQSRMDACRGKAEVIIGKHRHSEPSIVPMAFEGSLTRFSSLALEGHK